MGKRNREVERIGEDIQDIVDGLSPDVQTRWFGYKPVSSDGRKDQYSPITSPAKKSQHTAGSKNRKADNGKADKGKADNGDSDSSIEFIPEKPAKKKKRSTPPDDLEDDDGTAVKMSFYIYVETPPPPSLNIRKSSAKPPPTQTTELGPYKFDSSIPFTDFLLIIANACGVATNNLPTASMKWRFDRPANAAKKGLTNKTAFDVMIQALVDRKKDYIFSVFMPPPTLVKKELPWLKDENEAPPPDFEYNLSNATSSASKSIRDQIVAIDTASNDDLNELLEQYPIDNHPLFPGKRIFQNEAGFFDLNDIRLRVSSWAVAKAKGQAPASSHFFKNQSIKPARASAPSVPTENSQNPYLQLLLSQPNVLQPLVNPYQLPFPYPYAQPQNLYGYPHFSHLPAPPAPHALESLPVELPRDISLEEYCQHYNVNAEDRRVLTALGYVSGDEGIKSLDAASWETTKVLPLAKIRIMRQHEVFLKDIAGGRWN